ncbi:MAG: tetratricopeptide repeat protein [Planctomycetota bacterium]|jgi:tetratricopeptide (TPR) repeat protein|nr:tetratricopeptide repeat protein [Planctomycetota bacterium]
MKNFYFAILALIGSIASVYLMFDHQLLMALGVHSLAALLGGIAGINSDNRRSGRHWYPPSLAFCLPIIGPFFAYLLSESVKWKRTGSLSEEFALYLNDAASIKESVKQSDIEAPPTEELVSMADIISNPLNDVEQRVAVENLSSMETPSAMAVLRKVIDSGTGGEGRFFAMTAMARLEERIFSSIQRLEESIAVGRQSGPDVCLETAKNYLDFSYYQLAKDARRDEYLEKAREWLGRCMQENAFDPEAWIMLGRIELQQNNPQKALDCFNTFLRLIPRSRKGLLWRAEAWYMLGNYDQVRRDCLSVLELGCLVDNFHETIMFWAENSMSPWVAEERDHGYRPGYTVVRQMA